jgi:hypothetical protein
MKCGTLLSEEPRVDRKVFVTIGFPDFAFGISAVFSDCCLATVSDSETVFLCSLSSLLLMGNPRIQQTSQLHWALKTYSATSASAHPDSPFLRHGSGR